MKMRFNPFARLSVTMQFVTWFLIVSMTPLLFIVFKGLSTATVLLQNEISGHLEAVTQARGENLNTFFLGTERTLQTTATSAVFRDLLTADRSAEDYQQKYDNAFQKIPTLFAINQDAKEIFILDRSGRVVISSDTKAVDTDQSSDAYFTNLANGEKDFYLKDIYISEETGNPVFAVSAPIRNDARQLIGVLVEQFDASTLYSIATQGIAWEKTGEIYLINTKGLMVSPSRFVEKAVLSQGVHSKNATDCLSSLNREGDGQIKKSINSSASVFDNYRGVSVLGTNAALPGLGMCILAEVDETEALAPVISLKGKMALFVSIMTLILLFLAWYAARSTGESMRRPIREALEQLQKTSTSLMQSSVESASIAGQNASIVKNMAEASTEQSKQTGEISQSMSQMAAAIQEMSNSTQEVSAISIDTSKRAQLAGEAGEKSQKSLIVIKGMASDTANKVLSMVEKSNAIGEIVNTISSIAGQTNLLALNAAIEAARAGEAGRGFAVVADEVRKLAEEAASASAQIKQQIKGMVEEMKDTSDAAEKGVVIMDDSVEIITQTLAGMESAVAAIQQVSSKMQELSASAQEQSAAVQQVSKSIESISAVSEQNASGAQQMSASIQQQDAATKRVSDAATQLQMLAENLKNALDSKKA